MRASIHEIILLLIFAILAGSEAAPKPGGVGVNISPFGIGVNVGGFGYAPRYPKHFWKHYYRSLKHQQPIFYSQPVIYNQVPIIQTVPIVHTVPVPVVQPVPVVHPVPYYQDDTYEQEIPPVNVFIGKK